MIQEIAPAAEEGEWQLGLVVCDGRVFPAIEGRAVVRLTRAEPGQALRLRQRLHAGPARPAQTPIPDPGPPGPNPATPPNVPDPDLVISKQADRPVAAVGERVTYTVTIENRGSGGGRGRRAG